MAGKKMIPVVICLQSGAQVKLQSLSRKSMSFAGTIIPHTVLAVQMKLLQALCWFPVELQCMVVFHWMEPTSKSMRYLLTMQAVCVLFKSLALSFGVCVGVLFTLAHLCPIFSKVYPLMKSRTVFGEDMCALGDLIADHALPNPWCADCTFPLASNNKNPARAKGGRRVKKLDSPQPHTHEFWKKNIFYYQPWFS